MTDLNLTVPVDLPGPYIIGATGGSGTRVAARIVRRGGVFLGDPVHLNDSEDALPLAEFLDRWINAFLRETDRWRKPLPPSMRAEMTRDLEGVLAEYLAPLVVAPASGSGPEVWRGWGWKEPRSMYLLPFWHALFPGLRFLHWVRDGRDMAFSANQNQLRKHGEAMLDPHERAMEEEPLRSLALWSRINSSVADYGETRLRERYLRVRFEDLCREPVPVIDRIFAFFGLEGDAERIAREEVQPPPSLGRGLRVSPEMLVRLNRIGSRSLRRLGY